jgi:hypothetical protein
MKTANLSLLAIALVAAVSFVSTSSKADAPKKRTTIVIDQIRHGAKFFRLGDKCSELSGIMFSQVSHVDHLPIKSKTKKKVELTWSEPIFAPGDGNSCVVKCDVGFEPYTIDTSKGPDAPQVLGCLKLADSKH